MNEDPNHRKDEYEGLAPWKVALLRFFKGLGMLVGALALTAVLIFGLVLGACFLGK